MKDDFYLTLKSSIKTSFFPFNNASNFKINLGKSMQLEGNWYVGLSEIHYPFTLYNIRKGNNDFHIVEKTSMGRSTIRPGYYANIDQLSKVLNAFNAEQFSILQGSDKRIEFTLGGESKVFLGKDLASVLGARANYGIVNGTVTHPNIHSPLPHRMYVYCDLIKEQMVNDQHDNLLRVVQFNSKDYVYGLEETKTFGRLHYLPLAKNKFDSVHINIKCDECSNLAFMGGSSIVVLHFRKSS